ncbi:MAG: fumarylacetoacetate hydrolase family protein [Pseudonocardiales bacterium]|nr:fumarylacetoacetate hydrolase family protein [Pseudonocardiales bacterium]MBV9031527.1 fumarylacetoacetate hydrolase family protein [Pseudonocardiales bacterium]MBW0011253.1 fumarylacetoacetate hydrolase family protein [Pseudonocardiales bacterium]
MTTSVLRTADAWWVCTPTGAAKLTTTATTTAELLADRAAITAAGAATDTVPVDSLALVSPVTTPCRVVALATNYLSHIRDTGLDPDTVACTFFRKASGSISGPYDDVIKPSHVRLLDYELEIGLVFDRPMPVGTTVTADTLADYVAGLVVTNDISARDIQLPKGQYFESKSYPTFTPVGPALVLVDTDELRRFTDLRLRLWVNGELRQNMTAADMLYRPVEALQTLTGFQRLDPGDLLLTGTPVGTAISAPTKPVQVIASVLPPAVKWKSFLDSQARNPKYLHDGDVVQATVATDDGAIDLGTQRTVVRYADEQPPAAARHTVAASGSAPS